MIQDYQIGADIEVFFRKKKTKEIVTAEGLIKGTKDEPFKFDRENEHYATSLDNVMAEFNIPPASSNSEFYFSIQKALEYINSTIPKQLETVALPAARLKEKYLQTDNAKLFGW